MRPFIFRWVLMGLLGGCLVSCAPDGVSETTFDKANYSRQDLKRWLAEAKDSAQQGHFEHASDLYDQVEAYFPTYDGIQDVIARNLHVRFQQGDMLGVGILAKHHLMVYPSGPYAPYAMYMLAVSLIADQGSYLENLLHQDPAARNVEAFQQAFIAFQTLVRSYPHSLYADNAYHYLRWIRDVLARHDLLVARFYHHQKAYLAAYARAAQVIKQYPGSSSSADAHALMKAVMQRTI